MHPPFCGHRPSPLFTPPSLLSRDVTFRTVSRRLSPNLFFCVDFPPFLHGDLLLGFFFRVLCSPCSPTRKSRRISPSRCKPAFCSSVNSPPCLVLTFFFDFPLFARFLAIAKLAFAELNRAFLKLHPGGSSPEAPCDLPASPVDAPPHPPISFSLF